MRMPRKRLDSGTWGVMGIGMGYAIGAAVVSGKPVVAIDGDSGMEIATMCRYHLPIVTVSAISTRKAASRRRREGHGQRSRACLSVPSRTGRIAAPANWWIREGGVSLWKTCLRWLNRSSSRWPMP